ncbi:MAG TPA: TPM domain-containing protein [Candidatus Peribacteraceae bacterium]|nr:TPM domain-containing protein [Candidatus Peribacteraceae bacterium]
MVIKRARSWLILAVSGLSLAAGAAIQPAFADFTVPVNDGYVTDQAHILSQQQEQALEQKLKAYDEQTSNQIAVLIIPSLSGSDISDVAVQVGRTWGVGTKEHNNGLLMLISYSDHQINISTGYGLEGAVPDIVAKGVIDTYMVPAFRDGKYYEGIDAAIDALEKHIAGEYKPDRYTQKPSSGALVWVIFFVFIGFNWLAAVFARSKSWWAGGIAGGVFGIILTILYAWWLSIPVLVIIGLIFDYIVSQRGPRGPRGPRGRGPWGGFGGGGFGGGSGGGGGSFGGGSFGGGGASGSW